MPDDCIICRLAAGEEPYFIHEEPDWALLVSHNQLYLGRIMLIYRPHEADFFSLSTRSQLTWWALLAEADRTLKRALGADLVNWFFGTNGAYRVTPPNPHAHLHIYPRYREPPTFAGIEFPDPSFTEGVLHGGKRLIDDELRGELTDRIREEFHS